MNIQHEWRQCKEGEQSWIVDVIRSAYNECEELQVTLYKETYRRIRDSTIMHDRVEYRCLIDGKIAGVAILVRDYDMHVGDSWTIQWNYIKPRYRAVGIARVVFRGIRELAKAFSIPYSYTRRTGVGTYSLTYKYK